MRHKQSLCQRLLCCAVQFCGVLLWVALRCAPLMAFCSSSWSTRCRTSGRVALPVDLHFRVKAAGGGSGAAYRQYALLHIAAQIIRCLELPNGPALHGWYLVQLAYQGY